MNASLRTLSLPGAVGPVREHGASALDHVVAPWPAPDPTTRVLGVALLGSSPWAAPDPVMRFDLPAPDLALASTADPRIPWTDLVEPRYAVAVPDLHSASRAAVAMPLEPTPAPAWPAPTLADAAPVTAAPPARSGASQRWVVGLAAAAGALAVGAAAFVTLF